MTDYELEATDYDIRQEQEFGCDPITEEANWLAEMGGEADEETASPADPDENETTHWLRGLIVAAEIEAEGGFLN